MPSNEERDDLLSQNRSIACKWSHDNSTNSNKDCQALLTSLICSKENNNQAPGGRRFLLFGDSTMGPNCLFKNLKNLLIEQGHSQISKVCSNRYSCQATTAERCHNNKLFGLDFPINNTWKPPDMENNAEGPKKYGLFHPFCSDCVSCFEIFPLVSLFATLFRVM